MAHATNTWFALGLLFAQPVAALAVTAPPAPTAQAMRIVAVVNGDVISNADVDNRTRLFALSTGLPMTQDVLDRLKQQITRQLIDEKLRMQEVQRRHIVIPDKAIADAIHDIETRNNLPAGALRQKLSAGGAGYLTLIDQIRTQLGWTQVLREQLGDFGMHMKAFRHAGEGVGNLGKLFAVQPSVRFILGLETAAMVSRPVFG